MGQIYSIRLVLGATLVVAASFSTIDAGFACQQWKIPSVYAINQHWDKFINERRKVNIVVALHIILKKGFRIKK